MAGQIWEVVGGSDKGGILAREGRDLKSPELPTRLSTGALVRELGQEGDRLHFERLTGTGPDRGWASVKLKDKTLLVQTSKTPSLEIPAPLGGSLQEDVFEQAKAPSFYDLSALDIDGNAVDFGSYRERGVLIGNVASK